MAIVAIKLNINGAVKTVRTEADTPLLWVVRDELDLKGTKFGCGMGLCGACTVHVDGVATRSCITPVNALAGKALTTIEGLATSPNPVGRKVQQAWIRCEVPQCGYCQAGQIMSATALLATTPKPSDLEIDGAMAGNVCRCATYNRIREAIKVAAGVVTEQEKQV